MTKRVSFPNPSDKEYNLLPDKEILISDKNFKRLAFLCDYFKLNPQKMTEYLIKREYKFYICARKLIKKDIYFLEELKAKVKSFFYEISTNGDVVHYIKFLKDVEKITPKCKIGTITANDVIFEINTRDKKKLMATHNMIISYYPFEAIRREDINDLEGLKRICLRDEIIRVGRIIQILKDQGEIDNVKLIRSEPILPKTNDELYEEILSWG